MSGRADRRAASAGALLVVALGAFAAGSPGGVSAQAASVPACVDGFDLVAPTSSFLPEDVLARSASMALFAGGAPLGWGRRAAAIARHDAAGWKRVSTLRVGNDAAYMALGGDPARVLWAVGYVRTPTSLRPLAARRSKGGAWRRTAVPGAASGGATLTDVGSHVRSATWAVGYRLGRPGRHRPWALRWDGRRWVGRSPRLRSGERGMLAAVSVTRRGGTWVAGSVSRGSTTQPYIARRRGGGWQRQELPPLGEAALADILVTSDDSGWAVGYRQAASGAVPLVLRWDGVSWRSADTSGLEGAAGLLMGVSRGAGGRPSVVGAAWADGGARFVGLVGRLAEGAWSSSLLGTLPGPTGLMALDVDGKGEAWVTGRASGVGVTAHTCDTISPARARARTVRQQRRAEGHAAEEAAPDGHRHQAIRPPRAREGLAPVPRLRTAQEVPAGALTIRDRTLRSGLPSESPTWGAVVADFDGDGRDDIFLGRHGSRARLFLDRGRSYRDAGVSFGRGDRHGCAAADVDGSGSPDLYCAFGGMRGTGVKANQLWLDPGGPAGALDPLAGRAPEPLGRGRVVAFLDVDGDGLKDLFVGHETNRVDGLPSGNRVYLRDGPARFRALRRSGIATDLAAWAVDRADVDRDGRADLLLVYHDPKAAAPTSGIRLYRNTGGRFRDVTRRHRIRSIGERDAALARLDGDGRVDLVQLSAERIRVSLQRQGRFVTVYERRLAGGVAVGVGDVDGDGDRDLYILRQKNRRTDRDVLLLNGGTGRSWRAVSVPSRHGGRADDVLPIDHDQNGLTDFLVLNGAGPGKGPIQLIAFYR